MYATPSDTIFQKHHQIPVKKHSLVQHLADGIQTIWKTELYLSPFSVPEELGYIEGQIDGSVLNISNRCYSTKRFRKLHLELAKIGDTLEILHCVMFPRSQYALPIFGADIVAGPRGVSAAIVDLSPVTADGYLSHDYALALSSLTPVQFSECRQLPEWGDIFSRFCLFIRPTDEDEELAFLRLVCNYLALHCKLSNQADPVTSEEQAEIVAGHRNYCQKQKQNDKTRRILEKSFGTEWTIRYMEEMLFDIS
ncbi:MAG: phycocyanobilin:ferredoxin oxidoreductase [Cyanobacteria bacterium P01_E01_bin.45]